ncbi:hypothetical protein CDAR_42331 [Caerostris darwini]|uniref:Uncharacterized protein n=1 Tax=Caerostris darwini TaxID=1538125 RepID=A0AAV4RL66_9ARAC|nr:hypothetical protein CDAR_42331 [Caerostris darwini]
MTYRPRVRSRIHSSRVRLKSLQLPWRRSFIAVSISELLQESFTLIVPADIAVLFLKGRVNGAFLPSFMAARRECTSRYILNERRFVENHNSTWCITLVRYRIFDNCFLERRNFKFFIILFINR